MPKLPGDSSLVGCIQKITKNKPWVFKKRTLSLKHKPRAISYHLMNKPTIVKKQKCEWKNISNPHTSLWKKSVTFTFVVAGTSISALCSVLADGRKGKQQGCQLDVFTVTTTFQLSPCAGLGRCSTE